MTRGKPGSSPTRLEPGQREYRGYCEWALHPLEAAFILERGYAIVDGVRRTVLLIHEEAYVTVVQVDGTDPAFEEPARLRVVA